MGGTHSATYSERDPGDTAISCGKCCFRFRLLAENSTQHIEHVSNQSRKIKKKMMDAFCAAFHLRTAKNQFFLSVVI